VAVTEFLAGIRNGLGSWGSVSCLPGYQVLFGGDMLKFVVPIKQVPDIGLVKFDTEKGRVDRTSAPAEINPFDLNALEAAVQIKDKLGGTITAISMGPPQAESALKDALSRGADEAILLVGREFAGADTLATSYALASAIRKLGECDLIIVHMAS